MELKCVLIIMVRCTIKLGNSDRVVYQPGQTMTGLIQLYLDEPKKVRALYFIVNGFAECDWAERKKKLSGPGQNRKTVNKMVHYAGKDIYLNTKTYLLGSDDGEAIEIARGKHNFEFSYQLPAELPASFEASHGHINYNIEAGLDIPWGFDEKFKVEFTVVRHDDLNEYPELILQTESEEVKTFCRLFRKSKPLMMTVSLPHSGYVPGETVKICIKYVNNSKVDVHSTRIDLLRIIRFKSQTPQSKTRVEIEKIVGTIAEGVERLSRKEITKALVIPRVMLTSNEKYCDIVQISYELIVHAEVVGFHRNIELKIPITIGSVPLVIEQHRSSKKSLHLEDVPSISAPTLDSPPPTFDEAIKMKSKSSTSSKVYPSSLFRWNVKINKTREKKTSEPGTSQERSTNI